MSTKQHSRTPRADQMTWALATEAGGLRRAIARAQSDLSEALDRLDQGGRPASGLGLGRILSQSALDVDSRSSRLDALLDIAGSVLTEEQMVTAITGRN